MIEVKNLTKIFPGSNAKSVNDVSFSLKKGQVACLIGTSGCGKTTTLNMINLLIEPTSGYVTIDGKNSNQSDPISWRRKIGHVIQKGGLLPHLNVFQNISLLSKVLKKDINYISHRVENLMGMVNLPYDEYAHRYPKELSGGQQQRVALARALMEDPPVLLMDEPFSAIDPINRKALHSEFLELNKKLGKTILIVTHDIIEASLLGDTIILMHQGKIAQIGKMEELEKNPSSDFVKAFIQGDQHV